MLRSIFVFALMAFGGYYAIQSAFGALLLYLWFAYFRPEQWVWNLALISSLNFSLIVGVYLVLRAPTSDGDFRPTVRTVLLLLFLALAIVSTATSDYMSVQQRPFQDFVKVVLVTYLLSVLTTDARRLRLVLIVIVFSLGFESAKQGWVTLIRSPGAKNINFVAVLGDENETSVGLMMITPVLLALAQTATRTWEKRLHQFIGVGVAYRAISTYSRGGFLSAGAMVFVYILRAKYKLRTMIAVAVVATTLLSVLPGAFWDRMFTISADESERDTSAASRLHFWHVAVRIADDHPLLGVGVWGYQTAYNLYDDSLGLYGKNRAVHNSWLGMLSEEGYPGFILFVTIIGLAFAACESVIRRARKGRAPPELANYGMAIQTGLAAFCVGGSFVSFHYREILWHFIGISMALLNVAEKAKEVQPAAPAPPAVRVEDRVFVPVRRRA